MNYISSSILSDDFIWEAITGYISNRRRGTGGATFNMNCPMCASMGQSADKTYRCGVFHTARGIGVNCFNCQFKTGFSAGHRLGHRMRGFLQNIGVPEREVKLIALRAHQVAGFVETTTQDHAGFVIPKFESVNMPPGSKSLGAWNAENCQDDNYLDVCDYILARGDVAATAATYYWSPDPEHSLNRKLLIPCLHNERLVGWIGRSIDPIKQKYYTQIPKQFLFNSKALSHPFHKYIFIVEGVFDALVIDGVAAMGANLNAHQINWINQCDKIPVVIPDRDEAGKHLIGIAVAQNWAVAIPNYGGRTWWDDDLKDVDEAVLRHGRLFTLRSILETMTTNAAQITQRANYCM